MGDGSVVEWMGEVGSDGRRGVVSGCFGISGGGILEPSFSFLERTGHDHRHLRLVPFALLFTTRPCPMEQDVTG